MEVIQLYSNGPLRNYSYLLCSDQGEAWVIDPFYPDQIIKELNKRNLKLQVIINTHEHSDHTQGNLELVEKFSCEVWAHPRGKGIIPGQSRTLNAHEILWFGKDEIEVWHTPGHTFAHLCLLLKDGSNPFGIVTGDTLFNAGAGNCYNGGDPETLYQSFVSYFYPLADEIKVYPGHDYLINNLKFTLSLEEANVDAQQLLKQWEGRSHQYVGDFKMEKKVNTFLRTHHQELRQLISDTATEKEVFIKLRQLRNTW